MRTGEWVALGIVLVSVLVACFSYAHMPDRIASHWDANGDVNGYLGKGLALFLIPAISSIMFLLFIFLIRADPMKENIQSFIKYYDLFLVALELFLLYLFELTVVWNLGFRFNMMLFLIPGLSLLFFSIGVVMKNSKRNFTLGIRTAWTLANDEVWEETHKLGSKLFKAVAIIALLGLLIPRAAIWIFIVPVILVSIFLVVYSYVLFKRLDKKPIKSVKKRSTRK